MAAVLITAVAVSSIVYSASHIQKRFFLGQVLTGKSKAKRLEQGPLVRLDLPRAKGLMVPLDQAQDLTQLNDFLQTHTTAREKVLMYPEMGTVHFVVGRPWIGCFATATLAWLSPQWQEQWLNSVQTTQPRYSVVLKKMPDYFEVSYFQVPANRRYFDETMEYIHSHYQLVSQTPSWFIYERRGL